MAQEKIISLVGGYGQAFAHVRGDDGEDFTFYAGQRYPAEDVPASVLEQIEEGIPGHEFLQGTAATVDKHLSAAQEAEAEATAAPEEEK